MAYALIAVGYSMVFGILRLINFSHGAVYSFGAHFVLLLVGFNFGIYPAILASIFVTGFLGVMINKIALEPLRKKKSIPIASLITTIGLSYIIQNLLMIAFGPERKSFPSILDFGVIKLAGVEIRSSMLSVFFVSLILLAGLTILVNKTQVGLAMKAVQQNSKAASLMGINVNFIITLTFFLGSASASIAGALIGSYYQIIYPGMGFMVGLKAFAAAVLGGIGILHGSVVGGLIVGISECLAAAFIGGSYRDVVAFVILILVLIIKPTGIFGKKGITKV